jgi:prevent-host-death family protein
MRRHCLEVDHLVVHIMPCIEETTMQLPVSEAKARLTDLVRRAEAGEEIVLTRHGHAVVRLVAIHAKTSAKSRAELIDAVRAQAAAKATAGATAARSQDFLYDDEGLPK